MVSWFSTHMTLALSNLVLASATLSNGYYMGAAFCAVAALGMFILAWREVKDE